MKREHLHNRYKAIVIGGSAGSFKGITAMLGALPEKYPLPLIMCMHRLKHVRHGFVEALAIKSNLEVIEPYDKQSIKKGNAYLAPSNYHLSFELGHTFALSTEEVVNNSRPSIDITLETASYVFKDKLIGILLSGANRDGGQGMKRIHDRGGLCLVQEPSECMIDTMPNAAINAGGCDHVLRIEEIIRFLLDLGKQYPPQ